MTDYAVTMTDAGVIHDRRCCHPRPTPVSAMTEAAVITTGARVITTGCPLVATEPSAS
jgi:hypothetical protein